MPSLACNAARGVMVGVIGPVFGPSLRRFHSGFLETNDSRLKADGIGKAHGSKWAVPPSYIRESGKAWAPLPSYTHE
jgi:hypothetical protein